MDTRSSFKMLPKFVGIIYRNCWREIPKLCIEKYTLSSFVALETPSGEIGTKNEELTFGFSFTTILRRIRLFLSKIPQQRAM
jgi:hypothetical protein